MALLIPARASATAPKIVAVLELADTGFVPRLRGELVAAGFELVVVTPSAWPPTREEIELITRQQGAIAGLSLVRAGTGVEMWVVDRITNKTVFREVITGARRDNESLAIRLVETLRATLLEVEEPHLSVDDRPRRDSVPAPPEVKALLRKPPSRFALGVGTGFEHSPGGLGSVWLVSASFVGSPSPRIGVVVDGWFAPARSKVEGPEGEASVGLFLAGAALRLSPVDPSSRLRPWLGGGAWLGLLSVAGAANAPYVGHRVQSLSVVPHLDLGLRWSLARRISVGAGVVGALGIPNLAVQFADRQVASWGRPLGLASFSIETALD